MIRISIQLAVGIALAAGCTITTYQTNYTPQYHAEVGVEVAKHNVLLGTVPEIPKDAIAPPAAQSAMNNTIIGNTRLRPGCKIYVPLPVPEPVRVDFSQLAAAKDAKEINAVALNNVRQLHQQLTDYAEQQKTHYANYVKRCVVK